MIPTHVKPSSFTEELHKINNLRLPFQHHLSFFFWTHSGQSGCWLRSLKGRHLISCKHFTTIFFLLLLNNFLSPSFFFFLSHVFFYLSFLYFISFFLLSLCICFLVLIPILIFFSIQLFSRPSFPSPFFWHNRNFIHIVLPAFLIIFFSIDLRSFNFWIILKTFLFSFLPFNFFSFEMFPF